MWILQGLPVFNYTHYQLQSICYVYINAKTKIIEYSKLYRLLCVISGLLTEKTITGVVGDRVEMLLCCWELSIPPVGDTDLDLIVGINECLPCLAAVGWSALFKAVRLTLLVSLSRIWPFPSLLLLLLLSIWVPHWSRLLLPLCDLRPPLRKTTLNFFWWEALFVVLLRFCNRWVTSCLPDVIKRAVPKPREHCTGNSFVE